MSKPDHALWRAIMEYLRQRHAPICRQWFEELKPINMDSGLLQVCTSNSVQQNYLQRKCLDQFTEAAQAVTGKLVAVRFVDGQQPTPAVGEANGQTASNAKSTQDLGAGSRGLRHLPFATRPFGDLDEIVLSPDYAFENFIEGQGNRLAYNAAIAVANKPGDDYNPLFIHGGVGLGKTHLLQAICQAVLHRQADFHICYMSCDAFMNQFLECVGDGQMSEFRHRYRHVDMLVIDDIHFLANRERTQEEFFHTFNDLYMSKRQIVLSSDSPPNEIPQLEERLISRFQWGLVAPVFRPDFETRVAIVRKKARLRGVELPEQVVEFIAKRIDSNARELEGAITTLQAHAQLPEQPIDLQLAQRVLGQPEPDPRNNQVTLQRIIETVTAYFGVKLSDLQSKRRHKSITEPRQVCMWLARKRTRFSLQEIGGYFGGRDHTTVMHSIRTVDDRIEQDPVFAHQLSQLEARMTEPE
jgi:chromosomal replication initiator protein